MKTLDINVKYTVGVNSEGRVSLTCQDVFVWIMSPQEARALAGRLTAMADILDQSMDRTEETSQTEVPF